MGNPNAAKYIKSKTPKNVSGAIKKALDLSENLKKSQGNPTMPEAVGASELASMMAEVAQAFSQPQPSNTVCQDLQANLTHLQTYRDQLLAMTPQTDGLRASEKDILNSINAITAQMKLQGCPINANTNPQGI